MASIFVKPIHGSAGRIKLEVLTPDADDPVPAGAIVYPSGSASRPATVTIGSIKKFDILFKTEDGGSRVHYESEMTTTYLLWKEQIQGGTIEWAANIEAEYNRDATAVSSGTHNPAGTKESVSRFLVGAFVHIDFVLDKGSTYGIYGAIGKVHNPKITTDVQGNVVGFSCEIRGHGALPSPSIPA